VRFIKLLSYQTAVTTEDSYKEETHILPTNNAFKTGYHGRFSRVKNNTKKNATRRCHYIWMIQSKLIEFSTKWKLIAKSKCYFPTTNMQFMFERILYNFPTLLGNLE